MLPLKQFNRKLLENLKVLPAAASLGNIKLKLKLNVCFTGKSDTFTVTFICNDSYPGELKFVREEINSRLNIHDTFFEFHTALACAPAPVDCQVTGKYVPEIQVGPVQ